MNKESYIIDVSSVDTDRLSKKNRLENARKLWYKFSLNKVSVAGLAIILMILFIAVFYEFIAPYQESWDSSPATLTADLYRILSCAWQTYFSLCRH